MTSSSFLFHQQLLDALWGCCFSVPEPFLTPPGLSCGGSATCTACVCPWNSPPFPIHLPPSGSKAGLAAKHHPAVVPAAMSWWDAVQRCLLVWLLRLKSGVPAVVPAVPLGWCLVGWQLWCTLRHRGGMPAGLPSTFSHLSRRETKHLNICNFFLPSPQCTECVLSVDTQKNLNFRVYRLSCSGRTSPKWPRLLSHAPSQPSPGLLLSPER